MSEDKEVYISKEIELLKGSADRCIYTSVGISDLEKKMEENGFRKGSGEKYTHPSSGYRLSKKWGDLILTNLEKGEIRKQTAVELGFVLKAEYYFE